LTQLSITVSSDLQVIPIDVVLILAAANGLGIEFDQLSQWVLQAARNGDCTGGIGHTLLPHALASAVYLNIASDWQHVLRAKAAAFAQAVAQAPTPIEQCWYQFLELACLALGGALAGHWSHLYLDSQTCFAIPLVCPGY
jgi:hypothetical protein